MAVYGIGENKCLKEVVSKNDVYAKDNFIHYSKLLNNASTTPSSFEISCDELGLKNTVNLFVISHMCSATARLLSLVPAYALPDNYVEMFTGSIDVHFKNPDSAGGPMAIHLIFMLVDD